MISVNETLININATLVLQVIHFLILVFILNRIMIRPILKLVREREAYAEKKKNEIQEFEQKVTQLEEEFISKETSARKNATRERVKVRADGMTTAEIYINDAQKKVASIRTKASKAVEEEINKAQPLLKEQATALVDEILDKVIGRRTVS